MGVLPEGENNDPGVQKLYVNTEGAGVVLFEPLHPAVPEAITISELLNYLGHKFYASPPPLWLTPV